MSHCSCHFSMQVFLLCFFFLVQRHTPQMTHQDAVFAFSLRPISLLLQCAHPLSCFLPALSCIVNGKWAHVVDNWILFAVLSVLKNSNIFFSLHVFLNQSTCKTCQWKCITSVSSTQLNPSLAIVVLAGVWWSIAAWSVPPMTMRGYTKFLAKCLMTLFKNSFFGVIF